MSEAVDYNDQLLIEIYLNLRWDLTLNHKIRWSKIDILFYKRTYHITDMSEEGYDDEWKYTRDDLMIWHHRLSLETGFDISRSRDRC